jgi:hypothetical protein
VLPPPPPPPAVKIFRDVDVSGEPVDLAVPVTPRIMELPRYDAEGAPAGVKLPVDEGGGSPPGVVEEVAAPSKQKRLPRPPAPPPKRPPGVAGDEKSSSSSSGTENLLGMVGRRSTARDEKMVGSVEMAGKGKGSQINCLSLENRVRCRVVSIGLPVGDKWQHEAEVGVFV